jgi:hypothetical protein
MTRYFIREASAFTVQVVEDFVNSAALAFYGLRQPSPDARHCVEMNGHLLIGRGIEENGFSPSFQGQDEWSASFLYSSDHTRGIPFESSHRVNILCDVNHVLSW